jgi:hypothetical protein
MPHVVAGIRYDIVLLFQFIQRVFSRSGFLLLDFRISNAAHDQAIRQLIVFKKLESSRQGLMLEQLADGLDFSVARHPRTLRRDLEAIESAGWR